MLIEEKRNIDIHESLSPSAFKLLNLRTHSALSHRPRQYRSRCTGAGKIRINTAAALGCKSATRMKDVAIACLTIPH